MRRHTLGFAGLITLALAGAAAAQDDAVLLRYRFQPGQEYRYRMTMNGEMPVTLGGIAPPPGANVPGKIPVTMNWTMEMVQKVKSVTPEGAAAISFSLEKLEMTSAMMGMNMVARLGAGGKMETLMNGQPFSLPNAPPTTVPNPFYEATVDPTGKISGVNADSAKALSQLFKGQNIATMFNGMPGIGGLLLPEKAIKPGDTWDSTYAAQVPVQMPGPGGAAGGPGGAALPLGFTVHNKLARVEGGRAIIETQMSATAPPGTKLALPAAPGMPPGMSMSLEKMSQSTTGTLRFLVDQGAMEGGDYDARMSMLMAMGLPPGLAGAAPGAPARPAPKKNAAGQGTAAPPPAAAAPSGLKIGVDGNLKVKVERLAAGDAAPASPAAPAAP